MSKLVLANGFEFTIEEGSSIGDIKVKVADMDILNTYIGELTKENLKEVKVEMEDGSVYGEYFNLAFVSFTVMAQEEETDVLEVSIVLRQISDIELRLDAIEEANAIQDGAIEDLGEALSEIIEG